MPLAVYYSTKKIYSTVIIMHPIDMHVYSAVIKLNICLYAHVQGKDVSLSAGLYPAPTEQRFIYDNYYGVSTRPNKYYTILRPVRRALSCSHRAEIYV